MLEDIEIVLREKCGLRQDRLILVGVSGGADSLCLLHLLHRSGFAVRVAHFDHRLRPESASDAAAVGRIAADLSVAFVSGGGDVHEYASSNGLSTEAAARELRYKFLFEEARASDAQAVAVGHTADDQVETILMHFIRGTGLRGLGGMSHRMIVRAFDPVIPIVRPLLDSWHAETAQYCAAHGLHPLSDSTNASTAFRRNRIRMELLPDLEAYNPRIRETILRNAAALASDQALLDELLGAAWQDVVLQGGENYVAFELWRLETLSAGLQRQLLLRAARHLAPSEQIDFGTISRAVEFLGSHSGRRIDLGAGLQLYRETDLLYVSCQDAQLPSEGWPQMPIGVDALGLSIPSRVPLAEGWELQAESLSRERAIQAKFLRARPDRFSADLDKATLPADLEIRIRRPGDRFRPLGLHGHSQKLSDFFVNAKVPVRARNRWPLLCAGDTIVWVPGFRLAESFKLTVGSRQIARLRLKPPASGRF